MPYTGLRYAVFFCKNIEKTFKVWYNDFNIGKI